MLFPSQLKDQVSKVFALFMGEYGPLEGGRKGRKPLDTILYDSKGLCSIFLLPVTLEICISPPAIIDVFETQNFLL